jgi:hypothetical protein
MAKCTIEIHNSLERTVGHTITHHEDVDFSFDETMIPSGSTVASYFDIEDGKHGELHFLFRSVTGDLDSRDEGTFKCDNLKFPSKSNAIGDPSSNIEVTEAKYNSEHTESEIHIYVGGKH